MGQVHDKCMCNDVEIINMVFDHFRKTLSIEAISNKLLIIKEWIILIILRIGQHHKSNSIRHEKEIPSRILLLLLLLLLLFIIQIHTVWNGGEDSEWEQVKYALE